MQAVGVFKVVKQVFSSDSFLTESLKQQLEIFNSKNVAGGGESANGIFDFVGEIYEFCEGGVYEEKFLQFIITLKELIVSNLNSEGLQKG